MFNANLVLSQLTQVNNGMNRLKLMIDAKHFAKSDTDNCVSFKFMHGAANNANYIKITLISDDTYSVEFGKLTASKYSVISTHVGYYFDMLFHLFENQTKLGLRV